MMLFRAKFSDNTNEIVKGFEYLRKVLDVLGDRKRSLLFRGLLRRILAIGNYLNGTEARAFRLQALEKICDMKAQQDKNVTLLQFVVRDVCEHAPELCGFVEELEPLENATSVRLTAVSMMLEALEDSVSDLIKDMNSVFDEEESNFLDSMIPFLQSAEVEVESLADDLRSITLQAADVLATYGEDSSKISAEDPLQFFLGLILNFQKSWTAAYAQKIKDDESRKRKEELKKKEAEKAEKRRSAMFTKESVSPTTLSLRSESDKTVFTGRNRSRRMSMIVTSTSASEMANASSREKSRGTSRGGEDVSPHRSSRASPVPETNEDSVTQLLADTQSSSTRRKTRTRSKRAVSTTIAPDILDLL